MKRQVVVLFGGQGAAFTRAWKTLSSDLQPHLGETFELRSAPLAELVFFVTNKEAQITAPDRGVDLRTADIVLFRSTHGMYDRMAACAVFLQKRGIPFFDTARATSGRGGKLADGLLCWSAGLPAPKTLIATNESLNKLLPEPNPYLSYPLILKDCYGSKGTNNYLIADPARLVRVLQEMPATSFVAQAYVQNDGDYRFIVYGDEIALVFHRKGAPGSHLNNISQGGTGTLQAVQTFSPEVRRDVIMAAQAKSAQIAGVDLIFDKQTGQHYILEINMTPQLAGGLFIKEHMGGLAGLIRKTLRASPKQSYDH